jgi:S1-C subfamily serine protease
MTAFVVLFLANLPLRAQDVNDSLEKATKDAVKKVAPTVVQILTQGGADMVVTTPKGPTFRKALGPTTGVIVSDDGYIVTSLFNFVNNPTTILVSVPGNPEPLVAKRIANDRSRMLTLLKVEAKGLPVPEAAPKSQIHEGQFAIAMGRTLDAKRTGVPSVSVGIISALGRVWGKALQTDAKISPVNYGGPLVDVQGRVQGILVPVSPQGEDVTAGFEWYDSGIGFAIPFEDVLTVLPRLKAGKDLYKGILGIRLDAGGNMYSGQPKIAMVAADSAASKAGLKAGDVIVEVEGHAIDRLAQMQHILGTRYEGEHISLKYKRGDKVTEIKDLTLVSSLQVVAHPFLGILPLRDDPKLGVEIRYVFPGSPADKAGAQVRRAHHEVRRGRSAGEVAPDQDQKGRQGQEGRDDRPLEESAAVQRHQVGPRPVHGHPQHRPARYGHHARGRREGRQGADRDGDARDAPRQPARPGVEGPRQGPARQSRQGPRPARKGKEGCEGRSEGGAQGQGRAEGRQGCGEG